MEEEGIIDPSSNLLDNEIASNDEGGNGEISEKTIMDIIQETDDQTMKDHPKEIAEDTEGSCEEVQQEKVYQQQTDTKKKIIRMDTATSDSLDDSIRKNLEDLDSESNSHSASAQASKSAQENQNEITQSFNYLLRDVLDIITSDSSSSCGHNSLFSDPKTSSSGTIDQPIDTNRDIVGMDTASSDSLDDNMRKDLENLGVESDSQFPEQESIIDPMVMNQGSSSVSSKEQSISALLLPIVHHHQDAESLRSQNLDNDAQDPNRSFVRLRAPNLEIEACIESCSASPMVADLEVGERMRRHELQHPSSHSPDLDSDPLKKSKLKRFSSEPSLAKSISFDFDSQTPVKACELIGEVKTDKLVENSEMHHPPIDQIMHSSDTAEKDEKSKKVDRKVFESILTKNTLCTDETKQENPKAEILQERTSKRKSEGFSDLSPLKKMAAGSDYSKSDAKSLKTSSQQSTSGKMESPRKLLEIYSRKRKQDSQDCPSSSHPKTIKVELMKFDNQAPEDLKIAESNASSFLFECEIGSNLTSDQTKDFKESLPSEKKETAAKINKLCPFVESNVTQELDESFLEKPVLKLLPKNDSISQFVEPEEIIPLDLPEEIIPLDVPDEIIPLYVPEEIIP